MPIYVWHTGHQINETLSMALHAGIPQSILKHTEWADNYFNSTNKHVAVGYGILRGTGDIFLHNQDNRTDYYEVDRGYINPGHYDGYYRISKNGLQARYNDIDLPDDRLAKLKIERANWFNPKGKIIICPPSEYIEQYYYHSPGAWTDNMCRALKESNLDFKVRKKTDTTPLEHDLQDAYCVIAFNSNVLIDATIKGIPVMGGKYSIVTMWDDNTFQQLKDRNIAPPSESHVDKLLRFISYNQFTLEEIRNGTAWKLLGN